jgi:subtilisin family serine protease
MQKFLIALFSLLNILALQAQTPAVRKDITIKQSKAVKGKDHIPGVIIFKLKESGVSAKSLSINPKFNLKSASIMSMERKFPEARHTDKVQALGRIKNPGLERIYQIKISSDAQMDAVIKELLEDPRVEYAEPKYIHHRNFLPSTVNDPEQHPYLSRVRAPQAWALFNSGPQVIIGIVDSGSELDHEDLSDNIYHNPGEISNNDKDDDNNGKVDDYNGWDFVGFDKDNFVEDKDPNVKDSLNDHGVHVSGLASAVTNNSKGVASIAFNQAKLLIVKTAADNNSEDIYQGYEGVKYAADMGANIINCSWGGTEGGDFGRDIINYAISKNCLIVAAAGNHDPLDSLGDELTYPAAYEGVIAVANTNNADVKHPASNYGRYVSISAPGVAIESTTYNNSYDLNTGTSMSAPVVSSAAALVKSYYGNRFTMQQVGELLRATADNIDAKNPAYAGQLGRGRLNVYRALTEIPPSIRMENITRVDKAASKVVQPDTLYLYFDIKNFLFPVSNLLLTLSSNNPDVTIISPQVTISALGTLQTQTKVGPFKAAIPPQTPSNTLVDFRLNFSSGTYQDYENFSLIVAKGYIDIVTPSIATTLTSNGWIGYSASDQTGGLGFKYKGEDLLLEASLMIGNAADTVSNNVGAASGTSDEHFVKTVRALELVNNADSTLAEAKFDDSGNPNRLNIAVKQQMIGYKIAPNDRYAISEYEVRNASDTELKNVYVGLFTDWDVGNSMNNATEYDSFNRLAYTYEKNQTSKYAGVKLLSTNASPVYYPLSYELSDNPLSDDFTIPEKWETLSSGVKSHGLGTTGQGIDVSSVSGNGPYRIPAYGSIKVAFALIAGDNLADLKASAQAAQQKYNRILEQNRQFTEVQFGVYPNPLVTSENSTNTIFFDLPEDGFVSLDFYNLLGQRIKSLISNQNYTAGSYSISENFMSGNLVDIYTGAYFYRLVFNGQVKTRKIMVLR